MKMVDAADLYEFADDDEAVILDRLLTRAGITWSCQCGDTPFKGDACDNCGAQEGEQEVPRG